jgi:hypothetical protein
VTHAHASSNGHIGLVIIGLLVLLPASVFPPQILGKHLRRYSVRIIDRLAVIDVLRVGNGAAARRSPMSSSPQSARS